MTTKLEGGGLSGRNNGRFFCDFPYTTRSFHDFGQCLMGTLYLFHLCYKILYWTGSI